MLGEDLARQLAPLLERHGLTVSVRRDGTIDVRNPAGYVAADPRALALHPGLEQRVTVWERAGELWWCWLWTGPTRDAPPEVEPMVPVGYVDEAARRILNVLRVDDRQAAER